MNRAKLGLTAGAFGVGLVTMAIVGFLVLSLGFIRMPNSNAVAPLPVENTDALLSQDAVPHVAPPGDGSGLGEAIKVHGDWTIDVLEPDGTLVSHREFENSLMSTGKTRIARWLNSEILHKYWGIQFSHGGLPNFSPCLNSSSNPTPCLIQEPQSNSTFNQTFRNLVVSVDSAGVMTLSGTATAQIDGQINTVETRHNGKFCAPGEFPDSCTGASSGTGVTRTFLPTAIDVAEGQLIAVTVQISFE